MSQCGGGNGEGAPDVLPVKHTLKLEPQQVVPVRTRMLHIAAKMVECSACLLPLKPPIFKCDANHLVCSSCRGAHGESCGRSVVRSTLADEFAAAVFVPCDYQKYGCNVGGVVYHEAADHRRACQHAPCGCPERCGFSGSLQNLLKHISESDHGHTKLVICYGQPGALSLPLSERWRILIGEDNADRHRNAFLVSVAERGTEEVEVSLVCIRANGGVPPQFTFKLAVEHSDDGTKQTLEAPVMKSSSLSSGAPAPGEVKGLTVKRACLSGDMVPITVYIDRLAPPLPFSPNSRPFSPKPPPCSPKSPPFSPTRPFSPKPSPTLKRPFSPLSPSAASPPPPAAAKEGYKKNKRN